MSHSLEDVIAAEKSILGAAMMDPSVVDLVADSIEPEDWTGTGHSSAWAAMVDFKSAGGPLSDVRQVVRLLSRVGVLEALGGVQAVAEWAQSVPGSVGYYVGVVQRWSRRKKLDQLATELRARVESEQDPVAIAHWLATRADMVTGERGIGLQTLGDAAVEAAERIKACKRRGVGTGRGTGLPQLDEMLGGLFDGDMVVIAARPSVGKTALATQLALHVASEHGPVLFVSLEMSGKDLSLRIMSRNTGITVAEMRAADCDDDDIDRLTEAAEELRKTDVSLLYSRNVTTRKIHAACRLMKASGGLSMVVVDYLGLVKPVDWRKPRYEQIAESSAALKDVAMELQVPVIVLSQLNRDADKLKPMLSHLRDSGAVEQDADVVMLLHRESKSSKEATIDVAKNRQGATGEIKVAFDPRTTTFLDECLNIPRFVEFDEYAGEMETPF